MVVAKRCDASGEAGSDSSEMRGLPLSDIRTEWNKVFGNDVSALMEKCGYSEVEPLVKAIDGLQIIGEGATARAVTTRATFEGVDAPPAASAETGATTPSGQRRRPPPPPPTAPAPVLTPSGAKVLSLDTFVQSPSGKVAADAIGTPSWGGGMGFPGTPSMAWGGLGQWGYDTAAPPWQPPYGAADVGPPPAHDAPEPPSSSAL